MNFFLYLYLLHKFSSNITLKHVFSSNTAGAIDKLWYSQHGGEFCIYNRPICMMHYGNSDLKSHKLGEIFDKIKQACNLRPIFQATFHVNGCLGWFWNGPFLLSPTLLLFSSTCDLIKCGKGIKSIKKTYLNIFERWIEHWSH